MKYKMINQIDGMSKGEIINYIELVEAYALYSLKVGDNPLGKLLDASARYCSGNFNELGDLVPPKSKPTQTSELCEKIIEETNRINGEIAKKL